MGKKTKVWACNMCSETNAPCLCADPGTCYDVPRICPYYADNTANWNVSGDYEIIKKAKKKLTTTHAVLKSEYPELSALLTPTPNCSICQWIKADFGYSEIIGPGASTSLNYGCPTNYDCMAMGGKDAHDCHNTPECQALFKPVEVKADNDT